MLRRIVFAFIIAFIVALPALLLMPWLNSKGVGIGLLGLAAVVNLLNLPGSLCGLLFGGRFFPPEGFIGESPARWMLMVIVQTFIWFLILSCFHFVATRFKKADSDATRSI